jgi:TetR/AcrR family transcriptional regulator, mexCD-oprJ operon repressor
MNCKSGPVARCYGRRADAERNRESILDHATLLLTGDPAIGMGDIATASGIGRATLYRHFATREQLLRAIADRAIDETEHAIAASRLEEGTATEALLRLVTALSEIGDRYGFMLAQSTKVDPQEESSLQQRLAGPAVALFQRGQASGEFSRSLPPTWIITLVGLVTVAAAHGIMTGALPQERALDVVKNTLLYGLTGPK